MMKKSQLIYLLFVCLIFWNTKAGAQKIKSVKSKVHFFSDAVLEDIEASNTKGISVLNLKKKQIAFLIPINGFVFENGLMEEHFNENYLESDEFPNATFQGSLSNFSKRNVVNDSLIAKGKLKIHGVEKDIEQLGSSEIKNDTLWLKSKFTIKLEDYSIKIPKIVFQSIAEEIEVNVQFAYPLH